MDKNVVQQFPIPNRHYKVLCRCYTFNQASYIEDTLRGFVMQQTGFPFACLIVDDCSTDGEQEVIREFINRECDMSNAEYYEDDTTNVIYVQHRTNTNCYMAVYLLKVNLYKQKDRKKTYVAPWRECSEFEAICEGDDYWIDSLKLQKQVSFLENHTGHSMTFHAVNYLYQDGEKKVIRRYKDNVTDCKIEDAIIEGGNYAKFNTMMIRLSKFQKGYKEWAINCPVGDLPTILTLFENGKVGYFNDPMSVYRCDSAGSWTTNLNGELKKFREHYVRILDMWKSFDLWTDRKYHRIVRKKININRIQYFKGIIAMLIARINTVLNGNK